MQNRKVSFAAAVLTLAFTGAACNKSEAENDSVALGYSSAELSAEKLTTRKPQFDLLDQKVAAGKPLRMAIYLAYNDPDGFATGLEQQQDATGILAGGPVWFLQGGTVNPRLQPSKSPTADYAAQAYAHLDEWFMTGTKPFLQEAKLVEEKTDAPPYYKVYEGLSVPLDDPSGTTKAPIKWQIKLYLGASIGTDTQQTFMTDFGTDFALSDITLYLGHIADPSATKEQGQAQVAEYFTAAMTAFATQAPKSVLNYRILVYGGCGSERAEDLTIQKAQTLDIPQGNIDILANRGMNDYKYFVVQTKTFTKGLARGETWAQLLEHFKTTGGDLDKSIPVYRNPTFAYSR